MKRNGFTLVELLVVVGIIAILSAIMIGVMGGSGDSALAARCMVNMKNLASACQTYGMANGYYPLAGSVERVSLDEGLGIRNARMHYNELAGWLSWNSNGAYRSAPSSHVASYSWFQSAYNQDFDSSEYCYTNGALWRYVSSNRDTYICPSHARDPRFKHHPPKWSYVMNSYFGWDNSKGARSKGHGYNGVPYGELARADRRLLFAEMPFTGVETSIQDDEGSGTQCDCTLQYKAKEGGELIGFNHKSGKRDRFGHVVFADGHAEKLRWPNGGLTQANLKDLTEWLCEGKDVAFNGNRYEEMK